MNRLPLDSHLDPRLHVPLVVSSPDKLAESFESLGHLCELGIAQRFCGAEPLGLLRFASMPLDQLIYLVTGHFEALCHTANIDVLTRSNDHEWCGSIAKFGIEYHTSVDSRTTPRAVALARERKRVPFLARKLLEDLVLHSKVFVRRDPEQHPNAVTELYKKLQIYGPNDLLWIDQARRPDQIGTVERVSDGLLRAYLGHYWPNAAPNPGGLGIWLALLSQALASLRPDQWKALSTDAQNEEAAFTDQKLAHAGWYDTSIASVQQARSLPAVDQSRPVLQHTAYRDLSVQDGPVLECDTTKFQVGKVYVASAWVWLPIDFKGWIGITFRNQHWVQMWPADSAVRNSWQRIVTSFRCSSNKESASPGIIVSASAGEFFFSTCWQVERGVVPLDCIPHH